MVAVAVGHEHAAKGGDGDPQLVQPEEDLAAAAGIHQELAGILFQQEAGVVALEHHGAAGAEKGCLHWSLSCVSFSLSSRKATLRFR